MNKNNKGISLIIVLLFLFLISVGIAGYFYYFKNINISNTVISKPDSEIVESDKNKPYYSVGFIRYKLPELKPEILDKYFNDLNTNDEPKNCYEKKYFQNRGIRNDNYNNSNIAILEFGRPIGEPICKGAPGPYAEISFATASEDTSKEYDNKDFYNFVKTDLNSSKDITVFENKSDYESIGKVYFLIQDNNNLKNKLIISITPAVSDKGIHYIYIKEVIKTMDILKISQFNGIQGCPQAECKNIKVTISYGQLEFLDQDSGTLYNTNTNVTGWMGDLKFDKNSIYFKTTILNSENTEAIEWKLFSLNIKSGQIKELISTKEELKDFLIVGDKLYYGTGKGCGEVCPGSRDSYFHKLFSYDLSSNQTERLNSKNLTDLGYVITDPNLNKFGFEAGKLSIYKLEGNKLIMSFGQRIQSAEAFFYFDIKTQKVTNIDGNKYYSDEELNKKIDEFGLINTLKPNLFVRFGEITREN